MFKKLKQKIESKRASNVLSDKILVIAKDTLWRVWNMSQLFVVHLVVYLKHHFNNMFSKQTEGKLPDFLIIGAQKAGTSSLALHLKKHPSIELSPMFGERELYEKRLKKFLIPCFGKKELHFFDNDILWSQGLPWYKRFFRENGTLNFEATPRYIFSFKAHRRMHKAIPHAKLILILRNPIHRVYSEYNMFLQNKNNTVSFEKFISNKNNKNKECILRGFYIDQIEHLLKYFPREQLLVLVSEEMKKDPQKIYDQVFEFLNIEKIPIEYTEGVHKREYAQEMSPETVEKLKKMYAPYNERLFRFLGYRIKEWEK